MRQPSLFAPPWPATSVLVLQDSTLQIQQYCGPEKAVHTPQVRCITPDTGQCAQAPSVDDAVPMTNDWGKGRKGVNDKQGRVFQEDRDSGCCSAI
jgi:hypothetical protein